MIHEAKNVSRRHFLKIAGVAGASIGLGAGLGGLAAACGSGGTTTTTTVPYSTKGQIRTWTYTWSNFLLASSKGPRTDVSTITKFTYDSSGALTAVTNALNQVMQVTQHSPGGLPQNIGPADFEMRQASVPSVAS